MVSAPTAVTAVRRFSQRSITRNCAFPTVNSYEKAGNSGILCETRREILPARERTLVRDRTGMVLTTQYHAELRIAGCQFLRKVGNSGILCETRREILPARERTSVRDRTGMVLTTPYRAKLRIILLNCEKPCRARREVLPARERTLCA